jgi:hypothetical protein
MTLVRNADDPLGAVAKRCAVSGGLSGFGVAILFRFATLADGNLQKAQLA